MRFAALLIFVALSAAATGEDQPEAGPGPFVLSIPVESATWTAVIPASAFVKPSDALDAILMPESSQPADEAEVIPMLAPVEAANDAEVIPMLAPVEAANDAEVIPMPAPVEAANDAEVIPMPAPVEAPDETQVIPTPVTVRLDRETEVVPTALTGKSADESDVIAMSAQDRLAEELDSFCQRVDEKLTSVAHSECLEIGLVDGGADSNKATPLLFKDFDAEDDESAARVLLVGGVHGDEYSSVSIVFKWLAMLEENLGERFHWRVIPVLNPDGLLRPPRMSQRMNANGVDLNRNFPTPNWQAEAHAYWEKHALKNKRRYPGPAPLSEPETAWLVEQIESFQPHAVVSVHAPHGVVDFDGPRVPPRQLGPLELKLLGTYPGSMGRYIGIHKGIPLLTLELESAFGMPAQDEVYDIWYDMLGWLHEKIALPLKLAEESDLRVPATELTRPRPNPDEG